MGAVLPAIAVVSSHLWRCPLSVTTGKIECASVTIEDYWIWELSPLRESGAHSILHSTYYFKREIPGAGREDFRETRPYLQPYGADGQEYSRDPLALIKLIDKGVRSKYSYDMLDISSLIGRREQIEDWEDLDVTLDPCTISSKINSNVA